MSLSLAAAALMAVSSCKNGDISFPDYDTYTVYFGNQTPVRTIVLGEDYEADLTNDNNHVCQIGAVFGGSYSGKKITANVEVDNSLCDNIYLDEACTIPVKPLPADYYELASTTMNFGGDFNGYIDVKLTDKFFADENTAAVLDETGTMVFPNGIYVIPVKMVSQTGADAILTGTYDTDAYKSGAPARTNGSAWSVLPKDYTLYAVNYICQYSGYWLRSGSDVVNGKANTSRQVENKYTIDDEVVYLATKSLTKVSYTATIKNDDGTPVASPVVVVDFANGTVSAPAGAAYKISDGKATFTDNGAGKYWGDKERDLINVEFTYSEGTNTCKVTDKLVAQRRGIKFNVFSYNYKE